MLYKYFDVKLDAIETLEVVLTAADVLDRSLVHAARKMFPQERTRLIRHWGVSEGARWFGLVGENGEEVVFEETIHTAGVGRALQRTKVEICEAETKYPVHRGEQGELHVCSVATIHRYLGGRAAVESYEDEEGRWFNTGDTAVVDRTGVVFIAGRTKDTFVVNGRSIVPSVLEGCSKGGFDVNAVVVGMENDAGGNVAAAVVKGAEGAQVGKAEMEEYMKEKQGQNQRLKGGVWTLEELGIENWPYNSSNKIQKRDLVNVV